MALSTASFAVVAALIAVAVVGLTSGAQTWGRLSNNGYDGILIAVSDRVPEDQCHQVVSNLKTSFREASKLLYDATWRLASFRSIVVSLPPSWDARACGVGTHEEARVVGHGGVVEGVVGGSGVVGGPSSSSSSSVSGGFRLLSDDPAAQAAFVVDLQLGGANLTPYTVQPVAKCRALGKRVVIPHDFLTRGDNRTLALKGRLIVKEWAKFRYGVFDEAHRSATDPSSPSFYTPFSSNGPEEQAPTRCSNQPVRGHRNCGGGTCRFMPLDRVPENDGVYSSLTSYPELSTVTQFCNQSTHDPDVPTKHNIICDGRSTSEVIRSSLDFLGISPGPLGADTRPQIKFIQPKKSNIVLVVQATQDLDKESKLWVSMRGSISAYLHLLSNSAGASGKSSSSSSSTSNRLGDPRNNNPGFGGRQVGVVEVAGDVVLTKRPRELTPSSVTSEQWLSHYPSNRNDFCLECGIRKAIELLGSTSDDRRGEIVVIARERFIKPSHALGMAIEEAVDRGIMIHSVVIPTPGGSPSPSSSSSSSSNSAALRPELRDLSHAINSRQKQQQQQQQQPLNTRREDFGGAAAAGVVRQASTATGGRSVTLDDLDGNAPVHSMAEMLEALEKIVPPTNAVKVYQELKVPARETMTIEDRFPVDASPGGEFLVRIHSKEIPRQVSVVSPQGETPEPHASSEGGIRAPVLQTIRVQPWPSPSQTGQWTYKIQAVASDPVLVEVWMPFGAGSAQDEVIGVEGWTSWDSESSKSPPNPAESPLVIYARVTVGQRPVRLADVVARVKRTTADYSDEVEATLVDDGLGDPDSTKHDGIYSGYFTGFRPSPGTKYQITWVVTAGEGIARVPTIVGREPKSLPDDDSADPSGLTSTDMCCEENGPMTALPAFKRVQPGPTFVVEDGPVDDVYPPSRILDLRARVDVDRGTFYLSWTAPGGNYNEGTADRYELRYSANRSELVLESGGHPIQTPPPGRAGTPERMEFPVGQFGLEYDTKYYFAVRAFHGRHSRYSNAVPAAVPEPATEAPPLMTAAGGGVGGGGGDPQLDGPTRGTFSLTAGVVGAGNERAALLVVVAGVVSFVVVTVVATLCVCAVRRRRRTASKAAPGDKEAAAAAVAASNAPDVVASLEKSDCWDAKMHHNHHHLKNGGGGGGYASSQEASPVMTPTGTNGGVMMDALNGHQYMGASQILDSSRSAGYYSDQNGGYGGGVPADYGLEYGAYFGGGGGGGQNGAYYDPTTATTTTATGAATYGLVGSQQQQHQPVNGGYGYSGGGVPDYNTLETQRLVASSSDRMSYQSSQQSDSNSSSHQSEGKKFVHFSADALSVGNGGLVPSPPQQQQQYGTYPAGLKGPPPPVPPKPGYGDAAAVPTAATRLNESQCSVTSVDHKKIRTVTQV